MTKLIKHTIKDIWTSRLRSLLTIFGIVVGIASVTIMVSVGESSQKFIETSLSNQMDKSVLAVTLGEKNDEFMFSPSAILGHFNEEDYKILKELEKKEKTFTIARFAMKETTLSYANINYSTIIFIVDPEYHQTLNTNFSEGEAFNIRNPASNTGQIIIGNQFAKEIFGIQPAINKTVKVDGKDQTIRALVNKQTDFMGSSMNIVNMDYDSYINIYGMTPEITSFFIDVKNPEDLEEIKREITTVLKVSRNIEFGEDQDFVVQSQEDLLKQTREITKALKLFITVISSISLFVGGVGIMNIMLVSVKERIKEFGLRKAIGASNTDIMRQILTESIIFSIIGAIVGSFIGNIFAIIIQLIANLPMLISVNAIISSIFVSTFVGIVFGFYPALTAARLSPIEALRSD